MLGRLTNENLAVYAVVNLHLAGVIHDKYVASNAAVDHKSVPAVSM